MAKRNFENRTLYKGNNLDYLREINSETVDLIATDPPFNKGKDFHATPGSLADGGKFEDRWNWVDDVQPDWIAAIQRDWEGVAWTIEAARKSYGEDMAAFLCWLGVRVIEMHRVLKPTGSIYLHCDATASHYVRRMKWAGERKEPDRSAIVVNDWLTLSGIPDEAHEYIVGPRSALEWLIYSYRVKKDKESGIVNDPNDWGLERGQPSYIPDLIKSIVTVSVETVRTVRSLPPLDEAEPSGVKVAHKMREEAPQQGALSLPPEPEPPQEPPEPGVLYKGPTLAHGAEGGAWSTLPRCGVCLMPGNLREWGIWEPGSDRHNTSVWLCPAHEPSERM